MVRGDSEVGRRVVKPDKIFQRSMAHRSLYHRRVLSSGIFIISSYEEDHIQNKISMKEFVIKLDF